MRKGLKFLGWFFILTVVLFTSAPGIAEANKLTVSIDRKQDYDIVPYISNSRTMVPLRTISEELGHHIHWDNTSKAITIDENIVIKIGDKNLHIKDKNLTIKMDTAAEIKNEVTYVPIRFIGETLHHKVEYMKFGEIDRINIIKDYEKRFGKTKKYDNSSYFGEILNIDLKDSEVCFGLLEFGDDEDSPSGYNIVSLEDFRLFHLTNNTEYFIIDFVSGDDNASRKTTKEEFNAQLSTPSHLYNDYQPMYYTLETKGAEIIKIKGFYTP